jgi:hypothetical protein
MLLIQHADFRWSELACAQEVRCFALGDGTRESNSALRCPHTTRDLAGHYDPEAALHVCANCDGEQGTLTNHYPREAYRRRKCPTVPNIFGTTQRSGAPSVTESSVSSGITPGELLSVRRSAPSASRPARWATANGYADFNRLTAVAGIITGKFPAVQNFGTRRLRIEPSMQTPAMELSLLPIGGASPSARSWIRVRLGGTTILHRISSCTKGSFQHDKCPIILPLAVAVRRTVTRLK